MYNDSNVLEADDFTPEVPEYTYLNMDVALPCDGEGPQLSNFIKRLRDANGIPIVTSNDNPILDTPVVVVVVTGHQSVRFFRIMRWWSSKLGH